MRDPTRLGTARDSGESDDRAGAEALSDIRPSSTVVGLDEDELAVLRQVGVRWRRVLAGHGGWLRTLPVDLGPARFPSSLVAGRGGRFAAVDFVASVEAGEVVATRLAGAVRLPPGAGGCDVPAGAVWPAAGRQRGGARADAQARGIGDSFLGRPLVGRLRARGDARRARSRWQRRAWLSLPIALAIVVLMVAVGVSYRQLIRAYPRGGSYIFARENLGELPSLVAAAGLLIDYVVTVAVSISAGGAAVTSLPSPAWLRTRSRWA